MTTLQYITSKEFGCCTVAELMSSAKNDPELLAVLKRYAEAEMKAKGIPITEKN